MYNLLEDGEAELAQLAFQFFFLATAVLVAQGMELGRVVHVGEVRQFVANDVAHQFLGHEHQVSGQLDDLLGRAMPQLAHATPNFKACRL